MNVTMTLPDGTKLRTSSSRRYVVFYKVRDRFTPGARSDNEDTIRRRYADEFSGYERILVDTRDKRVLRSNIPGVEGYEFGALPVHPGATPKTIDGYPANEVLVTEGVRKDGTPVVQIGFRNGQMLNAQVISYEQVRELRQVLNNLPDMDSREVIRVEE